MISGSSKVLMDFFIKILSLADTSQNVECTSLHAPAGYISVQLMAIGSPSITWDLENNWRNMCKLFGTRLILRGDYRFDDIIVINNKNLPLSPSA